MSGQRNETCEPLEAQGDPLGELANEFSVDAEAFVFWDLWVRDVSD
jgi:hypothetical protein